MKPRGQRRFRGANLAQRNDAGGNFFEDEFPVAKEITPLDTIQMIAEAGTGLDVLDPDGKQCLALTCGFVDLLLNFFAGVRSGRQEKKEAAAVSNAGNDLGGP